MQILDSGHLIFLDGSGHEVSSDDDDWMEKVHKVRPGYLDHPIAALREMEELIKVRALFWKE